ncbi:MAG: LysR family transcriptional regulator, partial [Curvibacter sp.]
SAIAESLLDDLAGLMREPRHQNIQVDIEERVSKDIVSLVRDGVVSLGVCWSQVDLGGLESRPYRHDELVLAVPQGHPLAGSAALHFEDTLDFEHVGLPPSTAVYTLLHRCAVRAGKTLRNRAVVSNFDAAFRVVGAGLGVSVVPLEISRLHAEAGRIVTVPLLDDWAHRRFSICFKRQQDLPPAAQRLLTYLEERAAGGPADQTAT